MNVLSVHNSYQQPGGEDEVFRQEAQLLERNGHRVTRCHAHNNDISGKGSLSLLARTVFNRQAFKQVKQLIRISEAEVVHVHNTFPLLSPSVYYAAASENVPVVQTLHNYRLLCPAAVLYRDGLVCENCVTSGSLWPAVQHGCYRNSKPASAAAAGMLTIHRLLKTYHKYITTYIALSDFARGKFITAGLSADAIVIKPNFIDPDPGRGQGLGSYCLFAGRLTREKGIRTLLDAWMTEPSPPFDLEIVGDGELASEVASAVEKCPRIRWQGRLGKSEMFERMRNAAAVVVPSLWYEPFGLVVIEAFAMGVPVIASKIGSLADLVKHGHTGLHFEPGDPLDLAAQLRWLDCHPAIFHAMRSQARREFERSYTGDRNYSLLMNIYKATIDRYASTSKPRSNTVPKENVAESLVHITGSV